MPSKTQAWSASTAGLGRCALHVVANAAPTLLEDRLGWSAEMTNSPVGSGRLWPCGRIRQDAGCLVVRFSLHCPAILRVDVERDAGWCLAKFADLLATVVCVVICVGSLTMPGR